MYEEKLQQLGLTDGESRVYIALLYLGSTTVGPLVKKSGVAYSKIYEVLDRLLTKGLVNYIIKEKTRYYQAIEPNRLVDFLEKKELELQKNKQILSELLPSLETLGKLTSKTQEAEIFVGHKGILTAYEQLLKNVPQKEIVRFFYQHNEPYDVEAHQFYLQAGKFFQKMGSYFKKHQIIWRGIINKDNCQIKDDIKLPSFIQEKYVKFPIPSNIDLAGDKMLITAWQEKPVAILIHSSELSENFKHYFDSLWQNS